MAVDHRIRPRLRQLLRGFAVLRFLRQDAHASARKIFEQPRVMHVQTRLRIAFHPAVPRHARRSAFGGRHIFSDFGFDCKAKRCEAKARALTELRTAAVMETDIRGIAVVTRPRARIVELRPDVGDAQPRDS